MLNHRQQQSSNSSFKGELHRELSLKTYKMSHRHLILSICKDLSIRGNIQSHPVVHLFWATKTPNNLHSCQQSTVTVAHSTVARWASPWKRVLVGSNRSYSSRLLCLMISNILHSMHLINSDGPLNLRVSLLLKFWARPWLHQMVNRSLAIPSITTSRPLCFTATLLKVGS